MPKQRKLDAAEVLTDLLARLPWWLGPAAAVGTYVAATQLGPLVISDDAWERTWPVFGAIGAAVLMAASMAAAAERRSRAALLAKTASLEALCSMHWRRFEDLCAEAYRRKGYTVSLTANGADGGVDLVLRKGPQRIYVQCKRYKRRQIDVRTVRELKGVMAAEGATGGILISSGTFTSDALEFGARSGVQLVDGVGLLKLLGHVPAEPVTAPPPVISSSPPLPQPSASPAVPPPPRPTAPRRAGAPWSQGEDERLRASFTMGVSIGKLATIHDRSRGAIRARLIKLGLVEDA